MKICDRNHQQICYIHGDCPLCRQDVEIKEYLALVLKLRETIGELENRVQSFIDADPIRAITEGRAEMPLSYYRETISKEASFSYVHKKQC